MGKKGSISDINYSERGGESEVKVHVKLSEWVCGLTACHPGGIKTAMELTLLSGYKGANLSKSAPPWTVKLRKEITKCASIHRKEEASPFSRKAEWKETSFWF